MNISREEKILLLKIARKSIEERLFGKSTIDIPEIETELLNKVTGVFVTIHKRRNLRGCIGNIIGYLPLRESVKRLAIESAFSDPRFPPLSKEEYQEIDIEITILSELKDALLEDISPGMGVLLSMGGNSATYLPQVWEQLPTKEQFLSSLCIKAGLWEKCYEDPRVKFKIYRGFVFSEKELGLF